MSDILTLDDERPLGTPVTDPTEAQLMQTEYQLLVTQLLNKCIGTQPAVAIAACVASAFCVAVDVTPVEQKDSATKYLQACIADAFANLEIAFQAKAGATNGNDPGEPGQGSDQEVAH
jgi:hypothetical protein